MDPRQGVECEVIEMMGGYGFSPFWMMLMPLLWIVLLGVIIWTAVRLTQGSARGTASAESERVRRETPLEILDRRFASGGIDAAAYDEARARLSGRGSGPT